MTPAFKNAIPPIRIAGDVVAIKKRPHWLSSNAHATDYQITQRRHSAALVAFAAVADEDVKRAGVGGHSVSVT